MNVPHSVLQLSGPLRLSSFSLPVLRDMTDDRWRLGVTHPTEYSRKSGERHAFAATHQGAEGFESRRHLSSVHASLLPIRSRIAFAISSNMGCVAGTCQYPMPESVEMARGVLRDMTASRTNRGRLSSSSVCACSSAALATGTLTCGKAGPAFVMVPMMPLNTSNGFDGWHQPAELLCEAAYGPSRCVIHPGGLDQKAASPPSDIERTKAKRACSCSFSVRAVSSFLPSSLTSPVLAAWHTPN